MDNDECSFIDVTLGMARLQQLLAMFSRSHAVPDFSRKRNVCMVTLADEQHSFGATMVETFLRAGGWSVRSLHGASPGQITDIVSSEWFAVAGLTVGSSIQFDDLAATIRASARNRATPPSPSWLAVRPLSKMPKASPGLGQMQPPSTRLRR